MFHGLKATFILTFLTSSTMVYASMPKQAFEVEKGLITYDIYGGGALTEETNLTLRGNATLRFKDWGTTLLAQDEGVVETSGALNSKQSILSIEKQTEDAVYTVDFKNEKIHERKNSLSNTLKNIDTDGLTKIGEDHIAGLPCELWEGRGMRKCLYRGLPLKIESEILGIFYHKVATQVVFDINGSDEKCALPEFPRANFGLFNTSIKTKNETQVQCFTDVLRDVACSVEKEVIKNDHQHGIGKKEKTTLLNKIGKKIFQDQKELLPELLISMKQTRECLSTANDTVVEANQCMEPLSYIKEKLGTGEYEYIVLWDEQRKNAFLDNLEDEIIYLESRMSCIKRTQNITDLSACMK